MSFVLSLLALACSLYLLVLIGRLVFSWVQVFSRDWRPKGFVLVIAELVYSLTDPPLKFLARVIPPLRIGNVALDIGFMILFFAVGMLAQILNGLAR
ncbi:YggT family protein [Timonella senegalensis]|uniref:YggT family protein n=1 Tax=Timonella senegalensis TaxID=1465825 RepID=UPI00059510E3|nr:YggT family protein [Timonella senegalensis]